jgi:SAM-dependent MidA family methyltransferase
VPRGPLNGVVIANELLDNLPFRLAVFDGGWREVTVSLGPDSAIVETTTEPDQSWDWLPATVAHGTRLPIQDQTTAWVADAVRLLSGGCVIAFDYCTAETAELAARPWREWLRTYRAQGRGEHYLRSPGLQDITAQVCLDQLPSPSIVESQAEFLRRFGIDDLVEEGRRAWMEAASHPDVAALKMRSRTREVEALTEPRGLGAFAVASWQVATAYEHSP